LGSDLNRIRSSMVDGVRGMADALGAVASATIGGALGVFSRLLGAATGGWLAPLGAGLDVVRGLIQGTIQVGAQAIGELTRSLRTIAGGAVAATVAAVGGFGRATATVILGAARGLIGGVLPALRTIGVAALSTGRVIGPLLATSLYGALALGAVAVGALRSSFPLLATTARLTFSAMMAVGGGMATGMLAVASGVTAAAGRFVTGVWAAGSSAFTAAGDLIRGLGTIAWAGVKGIALATAGAATLVAGVGAAAWGALRLSFPLLLATVKNGFTTLWEATKGIVGVGVGLVTTLLSTAGGLLSGLASAGVGLLSVIPGVISGIATVVTGVLTGIANAAMAVVRGLANLIEGTLTLAANVGEKALGLLGRTIGAVLTPAMSALSADLTDWNRWIEGAMQGEVVMARLGAVLRGSGEVAGWSSQQLEIMAQKLAALGGTTIGEIREAQFALLKFSEIRGLQFPEALAAARQLAAITGQDLPAAAQMLGRALESPERGMQALRRSGIILSENERNSIKWLVASNRVADAQEVILSKIVGLGDVAGAMADTVQGHANRLRLVWESIGKAIGKAMLPFVDIVTEFLAPVVEGFAGTIKSFIGDVQAAGQGILAQARAWITEHREMLVNWGRDVGASIAHAIVLIYNGFTWLRDQVASIFASMGIDVGAGLAGIPGAIDSAVTGVQVIMENLPLVWSVFTDAAGEAFAKVRVTLLEFVSFAWDKLTAFFAAAVLKLDETIRENLPSWKTLLFGPAVGGLFKDEEKLKPFEQPFDIKASDELRRLKQEQEAASGAFQARLQDHLDEFKAVFAAAQAAADANRAANRQRQDEAEARARAARPASDTTPNPQDREGKPIRFEFTGLADQYKAIQKALTGTSPEALAKRQTDATNAVKTAVETKADQLLQFLKGQKPGETGFGV
jgi:hypothetical protein